LSRFRGAVPTGHLGAKYPGSLGVLWGSEIFEIVGCSRNSGVIRLGMIPYRDARSPRWVGTEATPYQALIFGRDAPAPEVVRDRDVSAPKVARDRDVPASEVARDRGDLAWSVL
jgi:hypothetical protein